MGIAKQKSPDPKPPDGKPSEYVIKRGLSESIKTDSFVKKALIKEINIRIIQASKAHHRIGILVNILLRECLRKNSNPLKIIVPEELFTHASFVYQLITGLENAEKDIPEVVNLLDKYSNVVSDQEIIRRKGDRNSLVTVAKMYMTTFKTYLQENFKRVQLRFLSTWCIKHGINKKFIHQIRYKINGWPVKDLDKDIKDEESLPEKVNHLIVWHRKFLGLEDATKVQKSWMKNNYGKIVIYFNILSKFLVRNDKKSILVAPLPAIKASYLFVDSSVFYGILSEIKYITKKDYDANPQAIYRDVFKINKLTTAKQRANGFTFTKTIQTDGVAIDFHLKRPKLLPYTKEIDRDDPKDRVIAQDPGRTTLFYGYEEFADGSSKKYKLSRNQFYTDAGIRKANTGTNEWNTKYLKPVLDQLSKTNSRSNKLKDFLKYVKVVRDNYDVLWNELTQQRRARQRLSLYSGKRSVYDKFFYNIKQSGDPEKRIVIAYGDAGFSSTSKYEISAPKTALEKQCSKWFKIVKVNEFRTTQLHCETGDILAKVVEKIPTIDSETNKKIYSEKTVRGLLWYNSTKGGKFIDRDLNVAKNILKCYRLYPNRPSRMDRKDPRQTDPPKHYISKKSTQEDEEEVSENLGICHEALVWTQTF